MAKPLGGVLSKHGDHVATQPVTESQTINMQHDLPKSKIKSICFIIKLPTEVHVRIIKYLRSRDEGNLKMTNHYFHSLVLMAGPPILRLPTAIRYRIYRHTEAADRRRISQIHPAFWDFHRPQRAQLAVTESAIEDYHGHDKHLGCYSCLRIYPARQFGPREIRRSDSFVPIRFATAHREANMRRREGLAWSCRNCLYEWDGCICLSCGKIVSYAVTNFICGSCRDRRQEERSN